MGWTMYRPHSGSTRKKADWVELFKEAIGYNHCKSDQAAAASDVTRSAGVKDPQGSRRRPHG
jgi:hypothetical protein